MVNRRPQECGEAYLGLDGGRVSIMGSQPTRFMVDDSFTPVILIS